MRRTALRLAAMIAVAAALTGCDKCGNLNITVPGAAMPKACGEAQPRG